MNRSTTTMPSPIDFTAAPLRNRIRLALSAPASDVWKLVGDVSRYPEYSAGIERVDAKPNNHGSFAEYVCHFKGEEGSQEISHRELVCWYEPNRGYASRAEEPNAFGLVNTLTLVTLDPGDQGTTMTWDQHYDAADLTTSRAGFDQALADIAERLVARFGGKLLERYVEVDR